MHEIQHFAISPDHCNMVLLFLGLALLGAEPAWQASAPSQPTPTLIVGVVNCSAQSAGWSYTGGRLVWHINKLNYVDPKNTLCPTAVLPLANDGRSTDQDSMPLPSYLLLGLPSISWQEATQHSELALRIVPNRA
jgi:hypothetical protein